MTAKKANHFSEFFHFLGFIFLSKVSLMYFSMILQLLNSILIDTT